jgi:hypothetical protein
MHTLHNMASYSKGNGKPHASLTAGPVIRN